MSAPRLRRSRADDLENELNRGALWAVTYGDLMSYLMIFFLVLFSFGLNKKSQSKEVKVQESLVQIQKIFGGKGSSKLLERATQREREESMVTQIQEALDRSKLSQFAQVESWDKKIHLVLSDAVLFDSGHAELKSTSLQVLREVAAQLAPLPNKIVIEGHTDSIPIHGGRYETNWELSMARAYAVLQVFEEAGINPSRLSGAGYGPYRPVADNSTRAGRAKNRRIEIDLIRAD